MIYMHLISLWKYLVSIKIKHVNWKHLIMNQIQPIHKISN